LGFSVGIFLATVKDVEFSDVTRTIEVAS